MNWISVKERLPDIDQFVIWYTGHGHMDIWHMDKDVDWDYVKRVMKDNTPTHWMPIPEPPV